jgi:hypothetical protein
LTVGFRIGASSVTKTSERSVGAGSKFVGQYQRAGRVELGLAEFQRPVRISLRARSKIVRVDDVVDLAPLENGTRLMARMTAQRKDSCDSLRQ